MKFFEAVEIARKTGKKIGVMRCGRFCDVAEWRGGALDWDNSNQMVIVDENVLDADWQVIEPPPKEYDFAEAYQMMKAGKRMRQRDGGLTYYYDGADLVVAGYIWAKVAFFPTQIDSKWIEVQP